jgi:hypothetical protein
VEEGHKGRETCSRGGISICGFTSDSKPGLWACFAAVEFQEAVWTPGITMIFKTTRSIFFIDVVEKCMASCFLVILLVRSHQIKETE